MKRLRSVYHLMVPLALALLVPMHPAPALGQGQAMPPIKVDLPPSPNFNVQNAPEQYPSGELSVYGLRKRMSKYLDKDVEVKALSAGSTNVRRSCASATTSWRRSPRRKR